MALSRTYYSEANKEEYGTLSIANTAKAVVWMLASFLTGLISGTAGRTGAIPAGARWAVFGSSDGVTAGLDGNARGLVAATFDPSKWVRAAAGVAHSTLILSKVIGGTTFYLILEMVGTGDNNGLNILITRTAPTAISVTAGPTYTNAAGFVGQPFINNAIATNGIRGSITMDASGRFWFLQKAIGVNVGKIATTIVSFFDLLNPPAGDTDPWGMFLQFLSTGAGIDTSTVLYSGSVTQRAFRGRSKNNTLEVTYIPNIMGGPSSVFDALSGAQDTYAANDPAQDPIELWVDTAGHTARRGTIPDFKIGAKRGDTFSDPSDAAIERLLVGAFWIPFMVRPSTS